MVGKSSEARKRVRRERIEFVNRTAIPRISTGVKDGAMFLSRHGVPRLDGPGVNCILKYARLLQERR